METQQALLERMRGFESDHTPDGWPAIRMREVSALCDALLAQQVVIKRMAALIAQASIMQNDGAKRATVSKILSEALALQPDLSALREHDADIREQCAKLCEALQDQTLTGGDAGAYWKRQATPWDCATRIRKGE